MNDELRLHLEKPPDYVSIENEIPVYGTKEEWQALLKMLGNEFIPHEIYNEIHSLLKKINEQLAR